MSIEIHHCDGANVGYIYIPYINLWRVSIYIYIVITVYSYVPNIVYQYIMVQRSYPRL